MAQVKFYSKASLPTGDKLDENGVYFIQGGELYKGSQRFGLGRVTKASTAAELSALTSAARGDINVGFEGAKVFDGSAWQKLGGDVADIRAIVSSMTSGLVAGGNGSYITGISQDSNGNVTANAVAFPALESGDNAGEVKLGDDAAKVNGWDALVASVVFNTAKITGVSDRVTGIEGIVDVSNSTVTATTGNFTDLNVTSTATFTATEVDAGSLKINNVSVNNVAASSATGSNSGVAVTVSTLGGGVSEVGVAVTGNLATFAGKTVTEVLGDKDTASHGKIATEKAVRDALNAFDNAMHFRGVFASPADCPTPQGGDIIIIGGAAQGSEYVDGQEWIYNDKASGDFKWEKIGDQSAVTGGTSTSTLSGVTVQVVTAAATAAPSVTLTGVGTAAAKDAADAVTANAATLPTCSAVASYVSTQLSYSHGEETVTSAATTLDAAMHAVAGAIDAYEGGTGTSEDNGVSVEVTINSTTMVPSVELTVNPTELGTALNLGAAASKGYVD